ncbi:MAG: dipeptidase E [Flavobacterium sp. BFFFF2]|nr:MAG: dipeptidase E [Flavobacterium sp. BFFFF2]
MDLSACNMMVASTSTLFGGAYLEYLESELHTLYKDASEIIFIPYARPGGISHDEYTLKAATAFAKMGKKLRGLHTFDQPALALQQAEGVFVGGGNTFVLVNQLYTLDLWDALRMAILKGVPYLGCSAGSNITGVSMQTTNDMPIVYPPSFTTLGILPFNINPHYLDADDQSKHMGETRETRLREFHAYETTPVVGLREGSWIAVRNGQMQLKGTLSARWFQANQAAMELPPNTFFDELM